MNTDERSNNGIIKNNNAITRIIILVKNVPKTSKEKDKSDQKIPGLSSSTRVEKTGPSKIDILMTIRVNLRVGDVGSLVGGCLYLGGYVEA